MAERRVVDRMSFNQADKVQRERSVEAADAVVPAAFLELFGWARQDDGCSVVARRFGAAELRGEDLRDIRSKLLALSQDDVSMLLGVSRNSISRIDNSADPDGKTRFAYLGLILACFFLPRYQLSKDPQ